jgi:hypothetical protein
MTKEKIQSMLNEGYNLNQIASIHMISKQTLQEILDSGACAPIIAKGTSGKTTTTTIKTTSSGGTEGTSGGSGTALNSTSGWQSEEGL